MTFKLEDIEASTLVQFENEIIRKTAKRSFGKENVSLEVTGVYDFGYLGRMDQKRNILTLDVEYNLSTPTSKDYCKAMVGITWKSPGIQELVRIKNIRHLGLC